MFEFVKKIMRDLWILKNGTFIQKEYNRLLSKYENQKRFTDVEIEFNTKMEGEGYVFDIPDVASFLSTFQELFVNENYEFTKDNAKPYIIVDFGANIGLSMLYFYEKFPNATITGFEADPKIFKYLEKNVGSFQKYGKRCFIRNQALWNCNTELTFYSQGADGGRVSSRTDSPVAVQAVDAHSVLQEFEHIDFLKIDIEGAERVVIPVIEDDLKKVDKIFIEYHSEADEPQCMAEIITILHNSGFRLYINSVFGSVNPYILKTDNTGFDLQLEIMGIKN